MEYKTKQFRRYYDETNRYTVSQVFQKICDSDARIRDGNHIFDCIVR